MAFDLWRYIFEAVLTKLVMWVTKKKFGPIRAWISLIIIWSFDYMRKTLDKYVE